MNLFLISTLEQIQFGRDMFAMVFKALGPIVIGLIVSFINITFGVFYGSISGYGGKLTL